MSGSAHTTTPAVNAIAALTLVCPSAFVSRARASTGSVMPACARMPSARPADQRRGGELAPRRRSDRERGHPHRRGEAEHVAQRTERHEPEQRRGAGHEGRPPREGIAPFEALEEHQQCGERRRAGKRAPDGEPARGGRIDARRAEHRRRQFRGGDVDGVTGRMRLVPGDVELTHAEGEIDGVEVLERAWEQAPIIYPESIVPDAYRTFISINPFTALVRSHRRILLEGLAPDSNGLAYFSVFATVLFLFGYWWFARTRNRFRGRDLSPPD